MKVFLSAATFLSWARFESFNALGTPTQPTLFRTVSNVPLGRHHLLKQLVRDTAISPAVRIWYTCIYLYLSNDFQKNCKQLSRCLSAQLFDSISILPWRFSSVSHSQFGTLPYFTVRLCRRTLEIIKLSFICLFSRIVHFICNFVLNYIRW